MYNKAVKLFQFVGDRTAEAILKDGFRDLLFKDLKKDGQDLKGVWLLNSIDRWQKELGGVDIEGGQVMLAVDIPEDALTGLEILMMDNTSEIRGFLVPASLVNSFGQPKIADVDLNWPGLLDDIYTEDIGEDPE